MINNKESRGRGRPPSEDGLKQRRNVSLDPDVQEMLVKVQRDLEPKFGFLPTLSQTVRYLIHQASVNDN